MHLNRKFPCLECYTQCVRCDVECQGMTKYMEKGNLVYKIYVFLNLSFIQRWKYFIIVLQASKSFLPWPEDLKVVGMCIDPIYSKILVDW